jgi:hypothetical protein
VSVFLSEGDLARLKALEEAPSDDWCRGTWAVSVLYALRMSDADVQVNWQKLAGRRASDVRAVNKELRAAKPEMRQNILTRFAKDNPEIRRKSA